MKKLFLAAAILGLGLAGCSKSEKTETPGGDFSLFLQVELGTSDFGQGTKADTEEVIDGTAVVFGDGHLYFTDATGTITRYIEINSSATAPEGSVSPTQLKNGVLIGSVPGASSTVHVFSNLPSSINMPTTGNISDVQGAAFILSLESQTNATYGIENASVYGYGDIVNGATQNDPREAEFDVAPLLSRIEIDKIDVEPAPSDGEEITKFTLSGIYINNYYSSIFPNGATVAGTLVNYQQTWGSYLPTSVSGGQYPLTLEGHIYDMLSIDYPTNNPVEPTNATWAYSTLAKGIPHIVLHLTDVEIEGSPYQNTTIGASGAGVAYVTVTGYIDLVNNGAIPYFEGGRVYKLEELVFSKDDLGDTPERERTFDVNVKINVMPWKVVKVGSIID